MSGFADSRSVPDATTTVPAGRAGAPHPHVALALAHAMATRAPRRQRRAIDAAPRPAIFNA